MELAIHASSSQVTFRSLLAFISPARSTLVLISTLLLVSSGLSLAQPLLAGMVTQSILTPEDTRYTTYQVLLAWVVLTIVRSLVGVVSGYQSGYAAERMTTRLRGRLYQHLQALPLGYHQQRRSGDTLSILSSDADIVSGFVVHTVLQILPFLLTFGGALVMMAWIDPLIAGLALLLLPLYYLMMKIVGRRIRPLSRAWVDAYSAMMSQVHENLGMLPAIKAYTRERTEQARFDARNAKLLGIWRKQLLVESLLGPTTTLLTGFALIGLLWLGGQQIAQGGLTAAELVSLLLYAMLMAQPLSSLANVYGQYQVMRGSAERILRFLQEAPEPDDTGLPDLPKVAGPIEFRDVAFHYPGGTRVLEGLNLKISAGETLAITGENGAGKSTIAHLLMRYADPVQGSVSINGYNLQDFSLHSLRSQIGLVAQHTLLINGSVAENIAYGVPDASMKLIEAAARKGHAHEFICSLSNGYETLIGDQGVRLSGGQRQRLALARALLIDPPILVLDEATAMFDPGSEESFIEDARESLQEKTVILITHRPASLAIADRILHLAGPDDGSKEAAARAP